jgi:hypothetical protein
MLILCQPINLTFSQVFRFRQVACSSDIEGDPRGDGLDRHHGDAHKPVTFPRLGSRRAVR